MLPNVGDEGQPRLEELGQFQFYLIGIIKLICGYVLFY